jgi:hypothetical protein
MILIFVLIHSKLIYLCCLSSSIEGLFQTSTYDPAIKSYYTRSHSPSITYRLHVLLIDKTVRCNVRRPIHPPDLSPFSLIDVTGWIINHSFSSIDRNLSKESEATHLF